MPGMSPEKRGSHPALQPDFVQRVDKDANEPVDTTQSAPIHRYFDGRPYSLPKRCRTNQKGSAREYQLNNSGSGVSRRQSGQMLTESADGVESVSYTHLTLPTIYSV